MSTNRTEVIVAIISLVGIWGVAFINHWGYPIPTTPPATLESNPYQTVIASTPVSSVPTILPTTKNPNVKITFYGYSDNNDTNVIADPLPGRPTNNKGDPIASGIGTYDNPITAAAAEVNLLLPPGTRVYVPFLRKYLLIEDDCGDCDSNDGINIWMESNADFTNEVQACGATWTPPGPVEVEVQPPGDHEVNPTPFFDMSTGICRKY